jgi:hypothetical protein
MKFETKFTVCSVAWIFAVLKECQECSTLIITKCHIQAVSIPVSCSGCPIMFAEPETDCPNRVFMVFLGPSGKSWDSALN